MFFISSSILGVNGESGSVAAAVLFWDLIEDFLDYLSNFNGDFPGEALKSNILSLTPGGVDGVSGYPFDFGFLREERPWSLACFLK